MNTNYLVHDVMTRNPISIKPTASLRDVARVMQEHAVGSVLVREGPTLIGICTSVDLVRKAMVRGLNINSTSVREIMTPCDKVVVTKPDMDIFEALNVMKDYDVRHLPVVHEGTLVGLITLKDILRIQPQLYELIVDMYEIREAERKPFDDF